MKAKVKKPDDMCTILLECYRYNRTIRLRVFAFSEEGINYISIISITDDRLYKILLPSITELDTAPGIASLILEKYETVQNY